MARNSLVDEFIKRLGEAERSHDPRGLAELFAPSAKLSNQTAPGSKAKKVDHALDALSFWSQYLHAFSVIKSRVTHNFDNGRMAILEWHAKGALASGVPIEYCGASIFEYIDGKISSFRTYYDSAALLPHAPRSEKKFSESVGAPEITNQATS